MSYSKSGFLAQGTGGVTTVSYASPSINKPQGVLARQYTFDTDIQSWTLSAGGSLSAASGQLVITKTSATDAVALEPSGASNVADGEVWCDYTGVVTSTQVNGQDIIGLVFRATDANNNYLAQINMGIGTSSSPQVVLYKRVSGAYTQLVTSPISTTNYMPLLNRDGPHRFMVRFVGPLISLYVNETFMLSWYDATFSTGRCGLYAYNNGTYKFDNVTVNTLASTWTALPYTPQSSNSAPQYQIPTAAQVNYAEVTSSAGTLTNQTWSTLNFDTIVTDPNNLFNTTTKIYTVPVTGTYLINMMFRADAAGGANVGFAVHTSNSDSNYSVWRQDSAGTGNRHTYNYVRLGKFNAGDQLRAFAYVDVAGSTTTQAGTMSIEQVTTAGVVASAAALPETVQTADTGTTYTVVDPAVASISNLNMTGNVTFTFPTAAAGKSFTLALTQDATGSRTATWPGTVKWPNGAPPSLSTAATKTDLFSFVCVDGTNWLGALAGRY